MAYPQTLSLDGSALSNDFCDDIATHGRGGGGVVCGVLLERGEVALDKTLDARKSEGMAGHNQMARRRMSGARAPFRSQSRLAHDCDFLCRNHRGMVRGRRVPGRRRRQRHIQACVWVTLCVCAFRWGGVARKYARHVLVHRLMVLSGAYRDLSWRGHRRVDAPGYTTSPSRRHSFAMRRSYCTPQVQRPARSSAQAREQ